MSDYRNNIRASICEITRSLRNEKSLDFGCGDGWFASQLNGNNAFGTIVPVDIKIRKKTYVNPVIYDGSTVPFRDREFDLVYAIDVVHHCPSPTSSLEEMLRVSKRYLLIKDHRYTNWLGKFALCILDEIGNKRFGIPSPYNYQKDWEWCSYVESRGFRRIFVAHPFEAHSGVLGATTNRLQFIGLWERV